MFFSAYSAQKKHRFLPVFLLFGRRKKRASLYAAGITQKLNGFNN